MVSPSVPRTAWRTTSRAITTPVANRLMVLTSNQNWHSHNEKGATMTRSQRKRLKKLRRFINCRKRRLKIPRGSNKHHRRPRSRNGDDTDRNISIVDIKQHESWHNLFSNLDPYAIAMIISQRWLDPDFEFVVRRKET